MPKKRHELFHNMAIALAQQQDKNVTLALAYWENVLRFLPEPIQIQHEILEECRRLVNREIPDGLSHLGKLQEKLESLTQQYPPPQRSGEDELIAQQIYKALYQQCGNHLTLALAYWKNVRILLSPDALVITLAVQDLCWKAHQFLNTGHIKECIDLYRDLLQTFPEFLEGYLNLSLIFVQHNQIRQIFPLFEQIPEEYQEVFIVRRYLELYETIQEISQQFEHVPYAAIEHFVSDLRIENTFYPSLYEEYFTTFITELVEREKRFFERRRKAREQKAIAKTSQELANEGIALGQRVTMAKRARNKEIHTFLYDNNIRIAEVLLNNPSITVDDVLVIAQTTHVSEILALIKDHYKWGPFHNVRLTVALNPQTLPEDTIRLLPSLNMSALIKIFHKKTLSPEVRIRAKENIQQRFQQFSLADQFALVEVTAGEIFKVLDRVQLDHSSFLMNLLGKFQEQPDIVVNVCRWKLTPPHVLAFIGRNDFFAKNIRIKFALLSNPKTPVDIVTSLLETTARRDLRDLLLNQHLPASVKQAVTIILPDISR